MVLRLLTILAAAALALPAAASADPRASFFFAPQNPRAGNTVNFTSTSCDPDGGAITQAWDLDGDGAFDDATGTTARATYLVPSILNVGLRVTGEDGIVSTRQASLGVGSIYDVPRPDVQRLMSPDPFIRITGVAFRRRTRVNLLSVRGPVCAHAEVTCTGRGCKRERVERELGPERARIKAMQRRLSVGALLEIRVTKGNLIGKYVRFRIRARKSPARFERCLRPGETDPSVCPQD